MKIDFEKIEHTTGRTFYDLYDLTYYVSNSLDYLASVNKNYNKMQYEKIMELKEFFNAIEFDLKELLNT